MEAVSLEGPVKGPEMVPWIHMADANTAMEVSSVPVLKIGFSYRTFCAETAFLLSSCPAQPRCTFDRCWQLHYSQEKRNSKQTSEQIDNRVGLEP